MTWDEAAIGYNGFAILNTRRDEWLNRLPVSFMSFGDFKAPLAIYSNGFFTALFGMNLWAVRLPFVLTSIFSVVGMMLLTEKISQRKWALAAGAIMALSPWHIHYSRAGFESGMSLFFFIWSLYFIFTYLKSKQKRIWTMGLAVIFAVAAIYSYHSAKIVVPSVMLVLVIKYRREFLNRLFQSIGVGVAGIAMLIPMLRDSVAGQGLERLGTTVLDDLAGFELISLVFKQFMLHLSPLFLIMGETTTLRHGDGKWGVLFPTTLVLVVIGLGFGLNYLKNKKGANELFYLGFFILVLGLMPAALGEEVPHSNRALLALPGFILLAVYGLKSLATCKKDIILKSIFGSIALVHFLLFVAFISDYFTVFAKSSAVDFKDGYLEAFEFVVPFEEEVEKILFTSDYGQPYIYALFVRQTNPIWYQGGSLIKYEFRDEINLGDLARNKTIVVASNKDEMGLSQADKLIYGSDDEVRFKIYLPKDK
jgi:4-amino-4-deoxy-L-arabinose transferase-like glycosyltransferase